jgi:hypothetical protein
MPTDATPATSEAALSNRESQRAMDAKPRLSPQEILEEMHRQVAAASDEHSRALRFARPEPVEPSHSSFGANWTCRHFAHLPRGCEPAGLNILVLAMTTFDCDWPADAIKPRGRGRWPLTN